MVAGDLGRGGEGPDPHVLASCSPWRAASRTKATMGGPRHTFGMDPNINHQPSSVQARLAATLLGIMVLVWVAILHLPRVAAASNGGKEWTRTWWRWRWAVRLGWSREAWHLRSRRREGALTDTRQRRSPNGELVTPTIQGRWRLMRSTGDSAGGSIEGVGEPGCDSTMPFRVSVTLQ